MKYLVVVEKGPKSWGAHVPDLPGCIAVARTRAEVVKQVAEAIEFHIEGLKQAGEKVPVPRSEARFIDIEAA
jgi:predicted RNase H-like HicB family nuclease